MIRTGGAKKFFLHFQHFLHFTMHLLDIIAKLFTQVFPLLESRCAGSGAFAATGAPRGTRLFGLFGAQGVKGM